MFARINTAGRSANDAEVRRGSLPGDFTDLVIECAQYNPFVRLTPISQKLINGKQREELVVRFFCFLETYDAVEDSSGREIVRRAALGPGRERSSRIFRSSRS